MPPPLFAQPFAFPPDSPLASDTQADLAGPWSLTLDPADKGIAAHWWRSPLASPAPVHLPGTTDLARQGPHQTTAPPNEHHLTREFAHVGPAWYQRLIHIPPSWAGHRLELTLERVMWQSRAWLNDQESASTADSLSTPHSHNFGIVGTFIQPGTHTLTLRIDNRMIHPLGDKSHGYGDQMQSCWNGTVGKLILRAIGPGEVLHVRLFPNAAARKVKAEIQCEPTSPDSPAPTALILLQAPDGRTLCQHPFSSPQATQTTTVELTLPEPPELWSEFHQPLYTTAVITDPESTPRTVWSERFGFRTLTQASHRIHINGHPAFLRGNLECACFPHSGHPPTDKADWLKIWKIYQDHHLNHARFHTWCPPRAAFEAADEAGIYLQIEAPIWMDSWMAEPNPRPEMNTPGHPQGLGKNDRTIDTFTRAEIRRILDAYGNHPSFVLFCIGNELGTSDFATLDTWIAEARSHDPRHLYAASTARAITSHCQFHVTHEVPNIGPCRARTGIATHWDYQEIVTQSAIPVIAHETGQIPVHPLWSETAIFTGPLRNHRLAHMAAIARANGVFDDAPLFRLASGASNQILNRDEIEGFLRTPACAGFQLLSMQDFPGQGEALVGWRDAFYQDKHTTPPETFRKWCAPTVPLLRFEKRAWSNRESLTATIQIHHSGKHHLTQATLHWSCTTPDGKPIATGTLQNVNAPVGSVITAGSLTIPLEKITYATPLTLTLDLPAANAQNAYTFWVFPPPPAEIPDPSLFLTDDWRTARSALATGQRVLFIATHAGSPENTGLASWMPLYWSVPFFPGQLTQTLGMVVRNDHAALQSFPTDRFGDWQWHDICHQARGFDLTALTPPDWKPIIQPVDDFHTSRKLGSLFELLAGNGRLLVCGYDIRSHRCTQSPATAWLRHCLLTYTSSAAFTPKLKLPLAALDSLFSPNPHPEQ